MEILAFGDRALLVNFEQQIDPTVNRKVNALAKSLEESEIPGINFLIPAYCSLTIGFDPLIIGHEQLIRSIKSMDSNVAGIASEKTGRTVNVPVCYADRFALDKEEVEYQTGLSFNQIVIIHSQTSFQVYMTGFLPGFPYMGILPKALRCSRKLSPRLKVDPGSVGLADLQTGIYSVGSPGGWQIIGRTPLPIFDPAKEDPFTFLAGDQVTFRSINIKEFDLIKSKVESKQYDWSEVYG